MSCDRLSFLIHIKSCMLCYFFHAMQNTCCRLNAVAIVVFDCMCYLLWQAAINTVERPDFSAAWEICISKEFDWPTSRRSQMSAMWWMDPVIYRTGLLYLFIYYNSHVICQNWSCTSLHLNRQHLIWFPGNIHLWNDPLFVKWNVDLCSVVDCL